MRSLVALAVTTALAVGCHDPGPIEPPIARVDLRAATGQADVIPAGIAIDPTGARFVFDERAGLYRLAGAGPATLVMALDAMPDPGVVVRPPFTDLVAVGPDRFAITAIGDGYLLDVAAHTMVRHFCYVPDGLPEDQTQRTDAIAFDATGGVLFAQPRTFDPAGTLLASQISEYLSATGTDVAWHDVGLDIAAGGMAFVPDLGLVVGDGSRLYRFDGARLIELDDLARFGVSSIAGLAVDPAAGTLLIVDSAADELVEIDRSAF